VLGERRNSGMRLCAPRVAVESIPCRGELCTLTLMLRSSVSGAPSGDMNHLSRAGIRVGTNVGIGAVSELVPGMEAKVRWGLGGGRIGYM